MEKERSTEGERDWAVHATLRREVTTLPGGGTGMQRGEREEKKKLRAGSREERRGRQMTDRQVWRDDDVQRRQRGERERICWEISLQ